MTTRVAFLRAVNVGTSRRVAMDQLRQLAVGLGHEEVWTHVNSGNVVFDAAGRRADLEEAFEQALEADLGFEVTTCVRSVAELERALSLEPFAVDDGDTYFVTFLRKLPSKSEKAALEALSGDFDTLVAAGRDVHWRMRGKSIDTEIPTKAWEDIVGRHMSTSPNTTMLRKLTDKAAARQTSE